MASAWTPSGTSPTTGPGRRVTRSCVPTPSSSGPTLTAVAWVSRAARASTVTLIPPTRRPASWNLAVAAATTMDRAASDSWPPGLASAHRVILRSRVGDPLGVVTVQSQVRRYHVSADTHATGLRGRQGAAARAASLIAVAEDLAGEFS